VSGPADLLRDIPAEFTLAAAIGIGAIVLVCLVLFHGTGIHWILTIHKRGERRLRAGRPHVFAALCLFGIAVFLLLTLHIIGLIAWAVVLTRLGLISKAKDAIYFCANAYTTLGYGQVDLDPQYRIISPIIGISGLFTFAWTTSALVNIVQAHNTLLEALEDERAKEKQLRGNLRQAVSEARAHERDAQRHEHVEATQEFAATSLLRHWQLWREERRKLRAIRAAFRTQTDALLRQELRAEDHLGTPPSDSSAPGPGSEAPDPAPPPAAPKAPPKP
jgi:hypothetical protein